MWLRRKQSAHNARLATARSESVCCPRSRGSATFPRATKVRWRPLRNWATVELIYDGPTDGDPKKQAEMIETWIVEGVDVICIAPNAPDVVANAMKDARAAGIHVITWDADGTPDSREFFVNQATPQAIGEGMVRTMINDVGGPDVAGDVVIISSDATSANQNAWIDAMKPALAASQLNLVTIKYPGENASNALADAQDVIKKYPESERHLRDQLGVVSRRGRSGRAERQAGTDHGHGPGDAQRHEAIRPRRDRQIGRALEHRRPGLSDGLRRRSRGHAAS